MAKIINMDKSIVISEDELDIILNALIQRMEKCNDTANECLTNKAVEAVLEECKQISGVYKKFCELGHDSEIDG